MNKTHDKHETHEHAQHVQAVAEKHADKETPEAASVAPVVWDKRDAEVIQFAKDVCKALPDSPLAATASALLRKLGA